VVGASAGTGPGGVVATIARITAPASAITAAHHLVMAFLPPSCAGATGDRRDRQECAPTRGCQGAAPKRPAPAAVATYL